MPHKSTQRETARGILTRLHQQGAAHIETVRLTRSLIQPWQMLPGGGLLLQRGFACAGPRRLARLGRLLTDPHATPEHASPLLRWHFLNHVKTAPPKGRSGLVQLWNGYWLDPNHAARSCAGTPEQIEMIRAAYREFNRDRFDDMLPEDLPVRFSPRMQTMFGTAELAFRRSGERVGLDIALNWNLLVRGNEALLSDTLLHEMAHVAAWMEWGDAGHGSAWARWAERVGALTQCICYQPIKPRRHLAVRRVPSLGELLEAA